MPLQSKRRRIILPRVVDKAMEGLKYKLASRLAEKGRGTFSSSHEIVGTTEELV